MEPIRKQILDNLGARCSLCGYDACADALTVEADRKSDEFGYRAKYLDYCAANLDRCRILCLNCKAHLNAQRRADAKRPKDRWYVWVTDAFVAGVKYLPLEKMLKLGYSCAIYSRHTKDVHQYLGTRLGDWPTFARQIGANNDPPIESFVSG